MKLPEKLEIPLTITTSEGNVREIERLIFIRERMCYSECVDRWECSECGFLDAYVTADFINYCPNCGAKVIKDA